MDLWNAIGKPSLESWPLWVERSIPFVALALGLLLVFAGGRLVRGGLITAGFVSGGGAGIALSPLWDGSGLFGVPGNWVLPIVGALVGACIALALFRFAVAAGAGSVFAGLGALVACLWWVASGGHIPYAAAAVPSDLHTVHTTEAGVLDALGAYWAALPANARSGLLLGVLAGGASGLVVGSLMPRATAAIVTALTGSACVTACAWWFCVEGGAEPLIRLDLLTWLAGWAGLGLLGAGLQLWPRRRATAQIATAAA